MGFESNYITIFSKNLILSQNVINLRTKKDELAVNISAINLPVQKYSEIKWTVENEKIAKIATEISEEADKIVAAGIEKVEIKDK